jgi:hypothetical protein
MEHLCDVGHVESHFGSFGDSARVGARQVHDLRQTYHRHGSCFGRNQFYSYVMWVMWNLALVHLEIVLLSLQDWCTVCAKRTTGSEIILDAPDGTPWYGGSSGSSFRSVWRQC